MTKIKKKMKFHSNSNEDKIVELLMRIFICLKKKEEKNSIEFKPPKNAISV